MSRSGACCEFRVGGFSFTVGSRADYQCLRDSIGFRFKDIYIYMYTYNII